jgi:hypothetical protein
MMQRHRFALSIFALALTWSTSGSADERGEEPSDAARAPLSLVARVEAIGINAEALRAALARELSTDVTIGDSHSPSRPQLRVEALSSDHVHIALERDRLAPIERRIDIASTGSHAIETIALVAANLLRDEAGELLHELRARTQASKAQLAKQPAALELPSGCDPWAFERTPIGVDFLPYVGSSSWQGTQIERHVSFNWLGGISGSVRGFELGGLLNVNTRASCGLQLSYGVNLVYGPVAGVQIGLANVSSTLTEGVQLGAANLSLGRHDGAQLGAFNLATRGLHGVQFGSVNVALEKMRGAQLSNLNIASGEASGLQLGQLNIATDSFEGAQIGVLNLSGGRVAGAMIGIVNIAENSPAAVGLFNLLWRGRTQLEVWGTDAGLAMVGVKHGGKHVHNIYGIGATSRDAGAVMATALGIGVRLAETRRWFTDIDAVAYSLLAHDAARDRIVWATIAQLRAPFGWRLTPHLALIGGPALNVSFADRDQVLADPALYESLRLSKPGAATRVRIWPGFTLGVQLL